MQRSREWNFAGRLVDRLGENSALIEAASGEALRGAQIADLVAGFAAGFLAKGLRPGDRVLVSCGLNAASSLAYLGAMYAGCVPVLIDERAHAASSDEVFSKANAKAAWSFKAKQQDGAGKNGFPQLAGNFEPCAASSLPPTACSNDDLAVLMPTSGSTGVPRLVKVSHGNLIANTEAIIRSQKLAADERVMLIMPVSYCFGASILHTHLYQGGAIVFDSRFMFPDKVLQAIDTYGCTTFAGVPTVYNILLRRSNLRSIVLPSLRRFLQAGGALAVENIRELRSIVPHADFYVMYGQTEATARISCLPAERLDEKLGSVGPPLDNLIVRIVDEQGQQVAQGQTGEIQVNGPSVCAGYLDDPDGSRGKFDQGWLRTGDLGCVDEDGYLWIKGRTSDFIKIRGYRVSLTEVETKVGEIAGVRECAAAGVPHPEAGEALALFIVKEDAGDDGASALIESDLVEPALIEKVRQALPAHWTCSLVRVVAELPRTANGKIARSELHTFA